MTCKYTHITLPLESIYELDCSFWWTIWQFQVYSTQLSCYLDYVQMMLSEALAW